MYTLSDDAVSRLTKSLAEIVRNARAVLENPTESHRRLEGIIQAAQKQLGNIKEGKYRTKPTQRMQKPHNA